MKKVVVIGVILLFLGLMVAPTINVSTVNASVEDEYIVVTSQVCGFKITGNNSVQLTKIQYEQLEKYLSNFQVKINKSTSLNETKKIYLDALNFLNSLGLFPHDITPQKMYNTICKTLYSKNIIKTNTDDYLANDHCLVSGRLTNTFYQNFHVDLARTLLYKLIQHMNGFFGLIIYNFYQLFYLFWVIPQTIFLTIMAATPIALYQNIGIGYDENAFPYHDTVPSKGWISTSSSHDQWNRTGSFLGDLQYNPIRFVFFDTSPIGVAGFSGIKIHLQGESFFLGSSLKVKINDLT